MNCAKLEEVAGDSYGLPEAEYARLMARAGDGQDGIDGDWRTPAEPFADSPPFWPGSMKRPPTGVQGRWRLEAGVRPLAKRVVRLISHGGWRARVSGAALGRRTGLRSDRSIDSGNLAGSQCEIRCIEPFVLSTRPPAQGPNERGGHLM